MTLFDINDELRKLPDKPGVYIMKEKNDDIIYIGKAVSLKNRLKQYFQSPQALTARIRAMVPLIQRFEYIVTDSEIEALILECNLIKKHKPKFNVRLKDDKNYPYIKVTMNENYPRVIMTRRIENDGGKYFGPYTNVSSVRSMISFIRKIYPFKTCNKKLSPNSPKGRPCLNYYLNQCLGPCMGNVSVDEYRKVMEDICGFLAGRHEAMIKRLEDDMKESAAKMNYEKAAKLRDIIKGLKQNEEKQKVLLTSLEDQDVAGLARSGTDACIEVFFIRQGKLTGTECYMLNITEDMENGEIMTSFVKQFYSKAAFIPSRILLQHDLDDNILIKRWLKTKKRGKINLYVPKKGDKLELVKMVMENAVFGLNRYKEKAKKEQESAKEGLSGIMKMLKLDVIPERIEAFDISNSGTRGKSGSMVVFLNGMPCTNEYRKFKIKGVEGQDDYASMKEIIYRRFKHVDDSDGNKEQSNEFGTIPGLILVDGGKGHVSSVKNVLREINISLPVYGMVKDERHRTRGLVSEKKLYDIRNNLPVLRFISSVQNEAHRFAINYSRKLAQKNNKFSILDKVEGIGEKRRKMLIRHFGSIGRIKTAEVEELESIKGISRFSAKQIYDFFH